MPKQVRLDDDVAAALELAVNRSGRSVAAEVNHRLRVHLGLVAGASSPAVGGASRITAPSGIIGAGKGPKADADRHRRARR
jgi:hypothetical protein